MPHPDTRERAILRGLAAGWDDTVRTLTTAPANLSPDHANEVLLAAASAHTHPSLPDADFVFLLTGLRDSVRLLEQAECGCAICDEDELRRRVDDLLDRLTTGRPALAVVSS
jgi:hypothetical protein